MSRRQPAQPRPSRHRPTPPVAVPPGWKVVPDTPQGRRVPKAFVEPEVVRVRNADVFSQLFSHAGRAAWRHRWQLSPLLVTGLVVVAAATSPATAATVLGAVVVAAHLAATRLSESIRGRVWLSLRERSTVALYAAGGTFWCAAVAAGWLPLGRLGLAVLAVLVGFPTVSWCRSRRIRKAPRLSARARQVLEMWRATITDDPDGPNVLQGSTIVPGSMTEPAGETLAFLVRLDKAHAEQAVGDDVRRYLEVEMELGVGTVQLEADRDHALRVKVTVTPDRHLENVDAPWPGPVLHDNGDIDFAVTPAGTDVRTGLHNDAGVEHKAVVGTTGTGKSNSVVTSVLPGVFAEREVVWYADGGLGNSAPHLRGACDWWAVEDGDEWTAMIEAAVSVCRSRRVRRGALGISSWRGAKETDPILTVACDEATLMLPQLTPKTAGLMLELLRIGRKVGVRVIQVTQDPMGEDWIGGRKARGLMAGGGTLVGHRPGDGTAAILSAGSTSTGIDLRALPPGPGWVGVIRRGQVLAPRAKVRYAAPGEVLRRLAGFTPRELAGEDLMAAGPAYHDRIRGVQVSARGVAFQIHDQAAIETAETVAESSLAETQIERALSGSQRAAAAMAQVCRQQITNALAHYPSGLAITHIVQETGIPRSTVKRALENLQADGQVVRHDGGRWSLAAEPVVA